MGEHEKQVDRPELWEKPEDYNEFVDFAISQGVPASAFWDDAMHCTCFCDSKDGDEIVTGIIHGMYNVWKAKQSFSFQEGLNTARGIVENEMSYAGVLESNEARRGYDLACDEIIKALTNVPTV